MRIILDLKDSKVRNLRVIGGRFRGSRAGGQSLNFLVNPVNEKPGREPSHCEFELKLAYNLTGLNPVIFPLGNFHLDGLEHFLTNSSLSFDQVFWFIDHYGSGSMGILLGRMFDQILNLEIEVRGEDRPIMFRTWLSVFTQENKLCFETSISWEHFPYMSVQRQASQYAKTA